MCAITCRSVMRKRVQFSLLRGRIPRYLAKVKRGAPHALSVWVRGPLGVVRESDFPERPVACLSAVVVGRSLLSHEVLEKY